MQDENKKSYLVGWHNKTASFHLETFNTMEQAISFQKEVRNKLSPNGSDYDGTYISEITRFETEKK